MQMKNKILIAISLMVALAGVLFAEVPQWWLDRGVIDTNCVARDLAPVTHGQAKHVAYKAWLECNEHLGDAGSAISNLVAGFSSTTSDCLLVNLGQLKYLAAPFYDQMLLSNNIVALPGRMLRGPYPWSASTNPPDDYAIANIGQLKYLFSFDFEPWGTLPATSLRYHMRDQIMSRVAANGYDSRMVPTGFDSWIQANGSPTLVDATNGWRTTTWKTYHSWGYGYTRTLVRNTNNVFKDVDLSCVSIMNNAQGLNQQAGTLVTEKHLILATHFSTQNGYNVGTKVVFLSMNNEVHTGTVAKIKNVYGDLSLVELQQEVPTNIVPCEVMGSNWVSHLIANTSFLFFIDQRKHVILAEMGASPNWLKGSGAFYRTSGVVWDSGCPIMALIRGKPVFTTVFTFPEGGTPIWNAIDIINNQINAWGSTNTLRVVDLSEFNPL